MITMFSTPKPFVGHIDVIQRNAIESWQRLHPDIEILLIGDDKGAAEVCQEFGIRHVKDVRRNRNGTKYLASIYDRAQEIASHDLLCHVNCDILLMSDFRLAVESVRQAAQSFFARGTPLGCGHSRTVGLPAARLGKKASHARASNQPAKTRTVDRLLCFLEGAVLPKRFLTS